MFSWKNWETVEEMQNLLEALAGLEDGESRAAGGIALTRLGDCLFVGEDVEDYGEICREAACRAEGMEDFPRKIMLIRACRGEMNDRELLLWLLERYFDGEIAPEYFAYRFSDRVFWSEDGSLNERLRQEMHQPAGLMTCYSDNPGGQTCGVDEEKLRELAEECREILAKPGNPLEEAMDDHAMTGLHCLLKKDWPGAKAAFDAARQVDWELDEPLNCPARAAVSAGYRAMEWLQNAAGRPIGGMMVWGLTLKVGERGAFRHWSFSAGGMTPILWQSYMLIPEASRPAEERVEIGGNVYEHCVRVAAGSLEIWFARGVGMVRMMDSSRGMQWELIDRTVHPDSVGNPFFPLHWQNLWRYRDCTLPDDREQLHEIAVDWLEELPEDGWLVGLACAGGILVGKDLAKALADRWLKAFAADVPPEALADHVTADGNYLWHIFSFKDVECLSGDEARTAFDALDYDRAIRFEDGYHWGGFSLRGWGETGKISARSLEKAGDVYITDPDFRWTYVKTHEGDWCGPYFCRKKDST